MGGGTVCHGKEEACLLVWANRKQHGEEWETSTELWAGTGEATSGCPASGSSGGPLSACEGGRLSGFLRGRGAGAGDESPASAQAPVL